MATSFDEIYAKFENRATNSYISGVANLYYYEMYQGLTYAISEFKKKCHKDLSDRINFSQEIYQFTGDGSTNDFTLIPNPLTDGLFYVSLDNVSTSAYVVSSNSISFTATPLADVEIYVGNYIIGQFNQTLDDEEISILADGMKVIFVSQNLYKTKQLSQMIYGNSVGLHSQANHNKTLLTIDESMYRKFFIRMCNYSYENDPLNLEDTVGDKYG